MSRPGWWLDLEAEASETHDKFSGHWWAAMRDLYGQQFPGADERSRSNMRDLADRAAELPCSCEVAA